MKQPLTYLCIALCIALNLSPATAYGQSKNRPPQRQQDTTIYYSIGETAAANNGTRATFSFSASIGQSDAEQTCGNMNRDAKPLTRSICAIQGVAHAGIPDQYTLSVIIGGENDPKSVYDLVINVLKKYNRNTQFVHQRR